MEGRVRLCSWTTLEHGYKIVLSNRPSVSTTAETFAEAEENFCIFSESFLALLSDEERSALNVRPVLRATLGVLRSLETFGGEHEQIGFDRQAIGY